MNDKCHSWKNVVAIVVVAGTVVAVVVRVKSSYIGGGNGGGDPAGNGKGSQSNQVWRFKQELKIAPNLQ